jgi:3-oxoadipate CoA-transferase alpha subunit
MHATRGKVTSVATVLNSADAAVAEVGHESTVMFGGFGGAGFAFGLRDALVRRSPKHLTIICNNADFGGLAERDGVRRMICSYPTGETSAPILQGIEAGRIELQLTPQGTLAEQIRAGGAGLGGVLTPTGLGLDLGSTWEELEYGDRRWVLAPALRADFAILKADVADKRGNLVLRHAARNFTPLMAMAAERTIVEVSSVVEPGELNPNCIHVPSAFVDVLVYEGGA